MLLGTELVLRCPLAAGCSGRPLLSLCVGLWRLFLVYFLSCTILYNWKISSKCREGFAVEPTVLLVATLNKLKEEGCESRADCRPIAPRSCDAPAPVPCQRSCPGGYPSIPVGSITP